jgi:UDP-2,3-diacylglucosamine pyrophosphatase LpxH
VLPPATSIPTRGIVVSDLHLFARRSQARQQFEALLPDLQTARVLVLNGDIFDFRWSTLPGIHATTSAALDWLADLLARFPDCEIHYIIGNHDCLQSFRAQVRGLATRHPRLHCHELGVRLGNALFLHGDCTHRTMNAARLLHYRQCWDNDRQHGELRARAYEVIDQLGITRFTHHRWFPQRRTVERIVHYLDDANPGWRNGLRDCYFGHTHLPFSGYEHRGIHFHNTGSSIRGMGFNPIAFRVNAAGAQPLPTGI